MKDATAKRKIKAFKGSILHFLSDPEIESDKAGYEFFKNGLLIVEDGYVQSVGPYEELNKNLSADIKITDYSGKLILPGFIDTHLHYPQTDIIASYGKQLLEWLEKFTFPKEKIFENRETCEDVVDFFLEELFRNGTTTAQVMCTVHKTSADVLFSKANEKNLRMIAGKVMMDRNAPGYLLDDPRKGYDETLELIEQWHQKSRLSVAVTPRFAITSTEEQLKKAVLPLPFVELLEMTIIHEIVHIGIEEPIVRKYNLDQWQKERVVDLICKLYLKDIINRIEKI